MAQQLTAEQESVAQKGLRTRLEKMRETVEPFLPHEVTYEQLMWGALVTAMNNSDIYECSSTSILTALVQAAQTGLTLGRTVFLVPFKERDAAKKTCTMIVHYRGYVELAIATGQVQSVFANVIRDGEHFEVWAGTEPKIVHRVGWRDQTAAIVGSYAVAVMRGGSVISEVMSAAQLEAIRREHSKKWAAGPMRPWWARKTPVRALQKYLPQTLGLYLANRYDERPGELLTMADADAAMRSEPVEDPGATPPAEGGVRVRRASSRLVLPSGSHISAPDGVEARTPREYALAGEVRSFEKPSGRSPEYRKYDNTPPAKPWPERGAPVPERGAPVPVGAPHAGRSTADILADGEDGLPF
jgi:recombination protein RecT